MLLSLVAELGPEEAVGMLRALADEIEGLMRDHFDSEEPAGTSNQLRQPNR